MCMRRLVHAAVVRVLQLLQLLKLYFSEDQFIWMLSKGLYWAQYND